MTEMLNDNPIVVVRLYLSHNIHKICRSCSYIIINYEVKLRLYSDNTFSGSAIVLTQN